MIKPNKYYNKKTNIGGEKFDSRKEAKRWGELKILEAVGQITELKKQTPFLIEVNDKRICKYTSDFDYKENGVYVVEDVKSPFTRKMPVYRIKNKLMLAVHGITIREV